MGAVTNMRRPVSHRDGYVPRDVTTRSRSDDPLTTQEYIEWGNPNDKPPTFT